MPISPYPPLTTEQYQFLSLATLCSSFLGIAGAFATILAYIAIPSFRLSCIARIALGIAVGDLMSVCAQGLGHFGPDAGEKSPLCQAQSFFQQFGEVLSILLISSLTLNLGFVALHRIPISRLRSLDKHYLSFACAMGLLTATIPLVVKDRGKLVYSEGYLWCYISSRSAKFYWLLYVPLVITLVLIVVTLVVVRLAVYRRRKRSESLFRGLDLVSVDDYYEASTLPNTTTLYLVVFIITWIPLVAVQMQRILQPDDNVYLRMLVMAIFLPMRGFANALVAFYQVWCGRKQDNTFGRRRPMGKEVW